MQLQLQLNRLRIWLTLLFQQDSFQLSGKDARVTPIFKSGARNDVNNYRPISVLPLVSKIMEHAIQVQFLAFLTEHDLFKGLDYQSGFRKKHSTETAVVYLTDYILEHMDRQMITGVDCLLT